MTPNPIITRHNTFTDIIWAIRQISCLEKKVDTKNIPTEEMKNDLRKDPRIGLFFPVPYSIRLSCAPKLIISINPAQMKRPALKRACVNKWSTISDLLDKDKMKAISPKLDSVEFAISFFKSVEKTAQKPPIHKVVLPISSK